jgi:hypothetical protein
MLRKGDGRKVGEMATEMADERGDDQRGERQFPSRAEAKSWQNNAGI